MSKALESEYNAFSLTTALKPTEANGVQEIDHSSITPPLALSVDPSASADTMTTTSNTQWSKMFGGMTKGRQTEVIGKAIQQVQESNFRGLRKGPLVAELRRGLKGVLPTSDSAKFFLMQAAFDCSYRFTFRADRWHWPPYNPDIHWPSHPKWTVLKPDGSIVLTPLKKGESVGVRSPWHPLMARAKYKKPELVQMVRVLVGEVPPKAKADELYAMLVGKLQPLGQP